jgi:hypothetical protein
MSHCTIQYPQDFGKTVSLHPIRLLHNQGSWDSGTQWNLGWYAKETASKHLELVSPGLNTETIRNIHGLILMGIHCH